MAGITTIPMTRLETGYRNRPILGPRRTPTTMLTAWPARVAAAHTLPRELRAHEGYRFRAERFQRLKTPTLLLVGGDSPDFFKAAIATVNAALLNSRVLVLPGQQHIAMDTAPELFVSEVLAFLGEK